MGGFGRESGDGGGDEAVATYVFFFVCSLSFYALFVMLMVEIRPLFHHHWNHSQLVYT